MKPPLRLHAIDLLAFGAMLFVLFLSASYFGEFFFWAYYFFLFLGGLSLLQLLVNRFSLRFSQSFTTSHPVKGETLGYVLSFQVDSFLPACRIGVSFKGLRQDLGTMLRGLDIVPASRKTVTRRYDVKCPFRGVYTVGVEDFELHDSLGLVSLSFPVWYQTFYIFPRLIGLETCRLSAGGHLLAYAEAAAGTQTDYTLFRGLEEYRPGQSIRHMAWKKFAVTGVPYLRGYDRSSLPGLVLYLDQRRLDEVSHELLEAEDTAVEALLAVAAHYCQRGTPVFVRTVEGFLPLSGDQEEFRAFVESTVFWEFSPPGRGTAALTDLLADDLRSGLLPAGTVAGVFPFFDQSVVGLLDGDLGERFKTAAVVVASRLSPAEQRIADELAARVNENETRLALVRSAASLKEDLS